MTVDNRQWTEGRGSIRKPNAPRRPARLAALAQRPSPRAPRSTNARQGSRFSVSARQGGFTIIELMVAVSLAVIMILGFSVVFTQSHRVVKSGQGFIRANAEAAAISQAMRRDFADLTKDGFLAIIAPTDDTPPAIVFTAAGTFAAKSPDFTGGYDDTGGLHQALRANAAIICYSIRENSMFSPPRPKNVLCREANLLTAHPNPAGRPRPIWDPNSDVMDRYLTDVRRYSRSEISGTVVSGFVNQYLTVPTRANTLAQVREVWPILLTDCDVTTLSITWLLRDPSDGTWRWHGFEGTIEPGTAGIEGLPAILDTDWKDKRVDDANKPVEFLRINGADRAYMALWTHEDKTNWPRAIRIRFVLSKQVSDSGAATGGGPSILDDSGKAWIDNQWAGQYVHVNPGQGGPDEQFARILRNGSNRLTVTPPWALPRPGGGTPYEILAVYEVVAEIGG